MKLNARSTTASKFPLFSSFPLEVRQMVWENALDVVPPRIVQFKFHKREQLLASTCPIPDVCFVNKESLEIASRYYDNPFISIYRAMQGLLVVSYIK